MTSIKDFEKQSLSDTDMSKIQGQGWTVWKYICQDPETGVTMQQRCTWFGLHGTSETRADNCGC